MSLLDDFKTRFANDPSLDLVAIENNWQAYDPVYMCYYCYEYPSSDTCVNEAIFQLIAHMSIVEGDGTNGGGVAPIKDIESKSWASESVTYGAVDNQSPFYNYFNSTKYGQRFMMIIRPNQGAVFV